MTTIGDLIDRTLRDWLHPPDDQPPQSVLTAALTADADNDVVQFDPTLFGPALDVIGPGHQVQVGSELVLVHSVDDAGSFTVTRAHQGTKLAAHAVGAIVDLPHWSRATLFDAMADAIEGLWPDLWREKTLRVPRNASFVAAPADLMMVTSAGTQLVTDPDFRYGRVMLPDTGVDYVTYKARYSAPRSESDVLEQHLGITDRLLHSIIVVDTVAAVIQTRDPAATTIEFITKALEAQSVPVGTGVDLRNALLSYREHLVTRAQDRQFVTQPVQTVWLEPW